jgi:hypothetical protein
MPFAAERAARCRRRDLFRAVKSEVSEKARLKRSIPLGTNARDRTLRVLARQHRGDAVQLRRLDALSEASYQSIAICASVSGVHAVLELRVDCHNGHWRRERETDRQKDRHKRFTVGHELVCCAGY